jgi:hypothetical protein
MGETPTDMAAGLGPYDPGATLTFRTSRFALGLPGAEMVSKPFLNVAVILSASISSGSVNVRRNLPYRRSRRR